MWRAYLVCDGDFAIWMAAMLSAKMGIGNLTRNDSSRSIIIIQMANCSPLTSEMYSASAVFKV